MFIINAITTAFATMMYHLGGAATVAAVSEAMQNPDADPNTKFEGWLHYEDNVRKQIAISLEDWIKSGKKEPIKV